MMVDKKCAATSAKETEQKTIIYKSKNLRRKFAQEIRREISRARARGAP